MLANRLSVLMAERQLSVKQVIQDTGLSRNTISNIANNPDSNISTETIDILCNYLNATPSDFFIYAPYQIHMDLSYRIENGHAFIAGEITHNRNVTPFSFKIFFSEPPKDDTNTPISNIPFLLIANVIENTSDKSLESVYEKLPITFQTGIQNKLKKLTVKAIEDYSTELITPYSNSLAEFISGSNNFIPIILNLPWSDSGLKVFNSNNSKVTVEYF